MRPQLVVTVGGRGTCVHAWRGFDGGLRLDPDGRHEVALSDDAQAQDLVDALHAAVGNAYTPC